MTSYVPSYLPKADFVADANRLQEEFNKAEACIYDVDPLMIKEGQHLAELFIKPSTSPRGLTFTHDDGGTILRASRATTQTLPVPVENSQRYTVTAAGALGTTPLRIAFELFNDTWIMAMASAQVDLVWLAGFSVDLHLALNGSIGNNRGVGSGPGLSPANDRFGLFTQEHWLLPAGSYVLTCEVAERRDLTVAASAACTITDVDIMLVGYAR